MQESSPENKKIKNAHPLEYEGIQFKSQLEKMAYTTLKEAGFPVEYEPIKFTVWEGFKPKIPFYTKDKKTRLLKEENKKLKAITYTPDFLFYHNEYMIVIEAKGAFNETYPIKRKLFRGWLEKNQPKSLYFEIFTKKQLLQAIETINNLN